MNNFKLENLVWTKIENEKLKNLRGGNDGDDDDDYIEDDGDDILIDRE